MLHLGSGMNSRERKAAWATVLSLAVFAGGMVSAKSLPHSDPQAASASAAVTFNRDIAPIMFRSCAMCHRPGEAGPFSLLTYSDAKKHARQIADVTRSRAMPPWLPEPQEFKFADDLRLPDAEINLIQRWVEQGAAEGDAKDLPPQPKF